MIHRGAHSTQKFARVNKFRIGSLDFIYIPAEDALPEVRKTSSVRFGGFFIETWRAALACCSRNCHNALRSPVYGVGSLEVGPSEIVFNGWQRTWLGVPIEAQVTHAIANVRNVVQEGTTFLPCHSAWKHGTEDDKCRESSEPKNVLKALVNEGHSFSADGIEIRRAVLTSEEIAAIRAEVSVDHEILCRTGIRNLEKKFSSIAKVAANPTVLSIAASLLGAAPSLVRALFFDKTPQRNWFVAWHQDRTVTLNRRAEIAEWGPWTRKDGVHHVQPPHAVLDHMVTIRLHVDDADEESGCLHVIPGSHRIGILTRDEIGRTVTDSLPLACAVEAGDAVAMHPLVLHSSAKSRRSAHRRVVHLEYSSYELPFGISWA